MKRLLIIAVATATAALTAVAPAAHAAVSITATQHGAAAPWLGKYNWVNFLRSGRITGAVTGVPVGTPVRLQAQTFPFTHAYAQVGQTVTRTGGAYNFTVHPRLATHYRVKSGGATSRTMTFYVQGLSKLLSQNLCLPNGLACQVTASYNVWLPAAVGAREMAQKTFLYVGLNRVAPKPPLTLFRKAGFALKITRVSSTKWFVSVVFNYQRAGVQWVQWQTCTREIESSDGIGLPVHTGCGNASIPSSAARSAVLG
jgi:hypothetical protein